MMERDVKELQLISLELKTLDESILRNFALLEHHMQQQGFEVAAEVSMAAGGALSWSKNEQGHWTFGVRMAANPQMRVAIDKCSRPVRTSACASVENLVNTILMSSRLTFQEMSLGLASARRVLDLLTDGKPGKLPEENPTGEEEEEEDDDDHPY